MPPQAPAPPFPPFPPVCVGGILSTIADADFAPSPIPGYTFDVRAVNAITVKSIAVTPVFPTRGLSILVLYRFGSVLENRTIFTSPATDWLNWTATAGLILTQEDTVLPAPVTGGIVVPPGQSLLLYVVALNGLGDFTFNRVQQAANVDIGTVMASTRDMQIRVCVAAPLPPVYSLQGRTCAGVC